MSDHRYRYLPEVNCPACQTEAPAEVKGNYPCPCCGCITIPNDGDALAYICPVCLWEIDLFFADENEPSDQNHGLTLLQARQNYAQYGAVLPRLTQYCRPPLPEELPPADAIKP